MKDAIKGLEQRFNITHSDGTPIDDGAFYFVLRLDNGGSDLEHIRACRKAILTYCWEVEHGVKLPHMKLTAKDLREAVDRFDEDDMQMRLDEVRRECVERAKEVTKEGE